MTPDDESRQMTLGELDELIADQVLDLESVEYQEAEGILRFDIQYADYTATELVYERKRKGQVVRPILQRRIEMRNVKSFEAKYEKGEVQLWTVSIQSQPEGKVLLDAGNGRFLLEAPNLEIVAGAPKETEWEEVETRHWFIYSSKWRKRGG